EETRKKAHIQLQKSRIRKGSKRNGSNHYHRKKCTGNYERRHDFICRCISSGRGRKHPVLLSRIPYGKHDPFYSHRYLDTNRLVENGYVVIIQDVRGRFASEGEFSMFQNEAKDGYDTVEWAAALSYSNGKVGMFGLSYYGYTQL